MFNKLTTLAAALFLTASGMAQNTWNFQFRAKTTGGTTIATTSVLTWGVPDEGFRTLGTLDLSAYLCQGDQFRLENLSTSTGTMPCSGANTITPSTLWDAGFGDLLGAGHPGGYPSVPSWSGSANLLDNAVWPASPGLLVTVPIGYQPGALGASHNNNNNDPNYVYYLIGIAPVMGCELFGVYNTTAGCTSLMYLRIKVKRAPARLTDVSTCPSSMVTNAQLGIPSGVTATSWTPFDPRTNPVNTTTNFTCTVSNGTCSYTDQVTVTVNQPFAEPFNSAHIQICATELPYYSNDPLNMDPYLHRILVNGTVVFDINGAGILNPAYFINDVFVIPSTGTSTVVYEYYTPTGPICSKTYTIFAEKNDIYAGPDLTICEGSSANINFTTTTWPVSVFQSGVAWAIGITNTSPFTVTPTATTTYTLRNAATALCAADEDQVVVNVVDPDPNFTYTYSVSGSTATLTASGGGGIFHTWELYHCTDILGSNPVYVATQTTTTANFTGLPVTQGGNTIYYKLCHTVRYNKSTPCPRTTCKVVGGTRSAGVATEEGEITSEAIAADATVFPNPTNGELTIEAVAGTLKNVVVYNAIGAVVYKHTASEEESSMRVDLSEIPAGIYMAHITVDDAVVIKRIVKE